MVSWDCYTFVINELGAGGKAQRGMRTGVWFGDNVNAYPTKAAQKIHNPRLASWLTSCPPSPDSPSSALAWVLTRGVLSPRVTSAGVQLLSPKANFVDPSLLLRDRRRSGAEPAEAVRIRTAGTIHAAECGLELATGAATRLSLQISTWVCEKNGRGWSPHAAMVQAITAYLSYERPLAAKVSVILDSLLTSLRIYLFAFLSWLRRYDSVRCPAGSWSRVRQKSTVRAERRTCVVSSKAWLVMLHLGRAIGHGERLTTSAAGWPWGNKKQSRCHSYGHPPGTYWNIISRTCDVPFCNYSFHTAASFTYFAQELLVREGFKCHWQQWEPHHRATRR